MDFQKTKEIYHRMPVKFRKHGDMPEQAQMYADIKKYEMYHIAKHTKKENTYDSECLFCNR